MKNLNMKSIIEVADFTELVAIDEIAVNEIVLEMENDSNVYFNGIKPLISNYGKKMHNCNFDLNLAVKGFTNLVTKYLKDSDQQGVLKVHDRVIVGYQLLESFMEDIEIESGYLTVTEVRERWNEIKRHMTREQKQDKPLMSESWMAFIDSLCKDGFISDDMYNNIKYK